MLHKPTILAIKSKSFVNEMWDVWPCDGDEGGDHAVEAEHCDHQEQLESAVPA